MKPSLSNLPTLTSSTTVNTLNRAARPLYSGLNHSGIKPLAQDTVSFSGSIVHDIEANTMDSYREQLAPEFRELIETVAYMQTQTFRQERKDVLDAAKAHLQELLDSKPSRYIAIAMDLDETLLDNTSAELQKMVSPQKTNDIHLDWRKTGDCPAIPETLEFFNWVRNVIWTDNTGQPHRGIPVHFVTARRNYIQVKSTGENINLTQQSIDNLNKIGITPDDYASLTLRPSKNGHWERSGEFKSRIYNELEADGTELVMVVGDMDSDFQGFDGYRAQLPNPLHR